MIPHVSGEPPPPCSNFSITSVSDTRAVVFGGFQPEADRLSDVYIVEFGKEAVVRIALWIDILCTRLI